MAQPDQGYDPYAPPPGYGGEYGRPARSGMPGTVKAVRVLLFVVAGVTILVAAGAFAYAGGGAYAAGRATWVLLPGIASLVLALLIRRRGRVLFWCLVALQVLYVLLAFGALGRGDPRGVTNLLFPIAILVLLLLPVSRAYFRRT